MKTLPIRELRPHIDSVAWNYRVVVNRAREFEFFRVYYDTHGNIVTWQNELRFVERVRPPGWGPDDLVAAVEWLAYACTLPVLELVDKTLVNYIWDTGRIA